MSGGGGHMAPPHRQTPRQPKPVPGLWAETPSLAALEILLADLDVTWDQVVVTDLSLGSWSPDFTAEEIAAQLDLDLGGANDRDALEPIHFGESAAVIGNIIDNESRGDQVVIRALDAAVRGAGQMQAAGIAALLVLVPCFGEDWDRFDLVFLRTLADVGVAFGLRAVFCCVEPGRVAQIPGFDLSVHALSQPPTTVVDAPRPAASYFPGLAGDDGGFACRLRGGRALVPPELRAAPETLPPGLKPAGGRGNAFFSAYWAPDSAECSERLRKIGGRLFSAGGHDLALRFLERARQVARSPMDAAVALSTAQGVRIANLAFAEAAAVDLPKDPLPDPMRGTLFMGKAWGSVMSGDAAAADKLFQAATPLLQDHIGTREYLYLRNIHALSKFRQGQVETAFEFEHAIEARLAALPVPDWHLDFINSINLARLNRHAGDLDRSLEYYRRAFNSSRGARSESDAVYYSHTLATTVRKQGDLRAAFIHMVRAALHWLTMQYPEALAGRVTQALLRRAVNGVPLVEAVSDALNRDLARAAADAGVTLSNPTWPLPVFTVADRATDRGHQDLRPVGCLGLGVLVSDRPATPVYRGASYDRLSRVVQSALQALLPVGVAGAAGIALDTHHGQDLPASRDEQTESGLFWGAREIVFEAEKYALPDHYGAILYAGLHPLISEIRSTASGILISYKRLLKPHLVHSRLQPLLELLSAEMPLDALRDRLGDSFGSAPIEATLRFLEERRVANVLCCIDGRVAPGPRPARAPVAPVIYQAELPEPLSVRPADPAQEIRENS